MQLNNQQFSEKLLEIDCQEATEIITKKIRAQLGKSLKRRGLVVAVSGGIDSSVTLGLCVKAVGPDKVVALQMPERHSSEDTLGLSGRVADAFGVEKVHEDITGILEAVGFYQRYSEAVRQALPEYGDGWSSKIVLPGVVDNPGYNYYSIVASTPEGEIVKKRLPLDAYLGIVAATNFKQRIRKMMEYYYADKRNYAVAGTPNRLEYDQGFFVKLGDGSADIKPIAHLYKTQVYALAEYLGVPADIISRPPTTDTYSMEQGQDEFYFSLPHSQMDLCLYGKNNGYSTEQVSEILGLTPEQVGRVYKDIDTKRMTTRYLHLSSMLIEPVSEL